MADFEAEKQENTKLKELLRPKQLSEQGCNTDPITLPLRAGNFQEFQEPLIKPMRFESEELIPECALVKKKLQAMEANLHRMLYTAQMMRTLMLDLLDLAQVESNTFRIRNKYFNLLEVIENAFMVVGHVAIDKNIRLMTDYNCDVTIFKQINGDERRYL
jgi:signal transduction histidine kinase